MLRPKVLTKQSTISLKTEGLCNKCCDDNGGFSSTIVRYKVWEGFKVHLAMSPVQEKHNLFYTSMENRKDTMCDCA